MHNDHGVLLEQVRTMIHSGGELVSVNAAQLGHTRLSGSASRMSGLDQLGHAHAEALCGAVGSRQCALAEVLRYLAWVDSYLATISAPGNCHSPHAEAGQLAVRPAHELREFCFPAPFVARENSLTAIMDDLAVTHFRAISEAAQTWSASAGAAEELARILDQSAVKIASAAPNEYLHLATNRLREGGLLARVYARNARLMASSVSMLGIIPAGYLPQVIAATKAMEALACPTERAAVEEAYVRLFYEAYSLDLVQALPPIRHLLLPAAVQARQHTAVRLNPNGDSQAATILLARHSIAPPRLVGAAGALEVGPRGVPIHHPSPVMVS